MGRLGICLLASSAILLATALPSAGQSASDWPGTWSSSYGTMVVNADGSGTYSHCEGKLAGSITGAVYQGTWSQKFPCPGSYGDEGSGNFKFTLSSPTHFDGEWTYASTPQNNHTDWDGDKTSGPPCPTERATRGDECKPEERWRTGFSATQKGLPKRSQFMVVSGGAGNLTTKGNPDKVGPISSVDARGAIVHESDLEVGKVSFDAALTGGIVNKRSIGRRLVINAVVSRSDDPTCGQGGSVRIFMLDARDPLFDEMSIEGTDAPCNMNREAFRPSKDNKLKVKIFAPEKVRDG